jgi:hypothetical protein
MLVVLITSGLADEKMFALTVRVDDRIKDYLILVKSKNQMISRNSMREIISLRYAPGTRARAP